MKKIVAIVVGVVLLAALIGLNVKRRGDRATEVDVAEVAREILAAEVSGSGRIEARRSVSITANVVGKVLEVAREEGDAVAPGDLILRIDPGDRDAALEQSRAQLARQQAQVALAEAELSLRRARDLVRDGLQSDRDLETAQTTRDVRAAALDAAREDVRNARAGVSHAEYELAKTVIRAEIPGVIVRLSVEEGENVLAGDLYNSGSAIVVIADLSEMEAQVLVDETEVVSIRKGQVATLEVDAFPDLELTGRVIEVGNSAYNAGALGSQEAKDYRVRVLLDEVPPSFRPGLSARAKIVTDERDGVLAVPIEALTLRDPAREKELEAGEKRRARRSRRAAGETGESDEAEGVFVVDGSTVRFAAVETGIAGAKSFEVVSGLEEGDRIVRGPFDAIRDLSSGDPIKIRKKKDGSGRRGRGAGDDREGKEDPDGNGEED